VWLRGAEAFDVISVSIPSTNGEPRNRHGDRGTGWRNLRRRGEHTARTLRNAGSAGRGLQIGDRHLIRSWEENYD
jgi:hypothetical protein